MRRRTTGSFEKRFFHRDGGPDRLQGLLQMFCRLAFSKLKGCVPMDGPHLEILIFPWFVLGHIAQETAK
jgi:hypothetical protein